MKTGRNGYFSGSQATEESLPAEDLASLHDLLEGHKVLNPPAEPGLGFWCLLSQHGCWGVLQVELLLRWRQSLYKALGFRFWGDFNK